MNQTFPWPWFAKILICCDFNVSGQQPWRCSGGFRLWITWKAESPGSRYLCGTGALARVPTYNCVEQPGSPQARFWIAGLELPLLHVMPAVFFRLRRSGF
jgi:hypothetical protein